MSDKRAVVAPGRELLGIGELWNTCASEAESTSAKGAPVDGSSTANVPPSPGTNAPSM